MQSQIVDSPSEATFQSRLKIHRILSTLINTPCSESHPVTAVTGDITHLKAFAHVYTPKTTRTAATRIKEKFERSSYTWRTL